MHPSRFVFSGFRLLTGIFLIVFSMVGATFYYLDGAIAPPTQTVVTIQAPSTHAVGADSPEVKSTTVTPLPKQRIRLLSASQAELESLPRIGPVTAKAILELRAQGKLKTVEDLDNVKGIGPKTLEQLRPLVEL